MESAWNLGKKIALAIGLLFAAFGVQCLFDGQQRADDFERWKTAKPLDGIVDFSTPGQFVFPYEQTCSSAHGQDVVLKLPPEVLRGTTATQLLDGLKAQIEIKATATSNVVASGHSENEPDLRVDGDSISVFHLAPFRKGSYVATITVSQGAHALKGTPQRLHGRYLLCGLEKMSATIATVIGTLCLTIGGLITFAIFWKTGLFRKRF